MSLVFGVFVAAASTANAQATATKKTPGEVADSAACHIAPGLEMGNISLGGGGGGRTTQSEAKLKNPKITAKDSARVRAAQAEFDSLTKAGAAPALPKARFVNCNGETRLIEGDGMTDTTAK